jgi:hypothetical protein
MEVVEAAWPAIAAREASPEDAETCRLAALTATKVQDFATARVWRVRGLTRAITSIWHVGVASLILSDVFVELARSNDDYPDGRLLDVLRPARVALTIIDEMETLARGLTDEIALGFGAPTAATIERFVHENRGLLLLIAGRLEDARKSYARAVEAVGSNDRSRVKSLLGSALVSYVIALPAGTASAEPTRMLTDEAEAMGFVDLVVAGRHNVAEMEQSGRGLALYAIL